MGVFRVNKSKDYTVMSNDHLRNKNLSLKAKGLLSMMLSLPDDWDYSVEGLVAISQESTTSIRGILKELEDNGYLVRERAQNEKGQFEYIYNIYEQPSSKKPCTEKPYTENPHTDEPYTENDRQLNTNILNTKKLNTKELNTNKAKKEKFAEFVSMTNEEYSKLTSQYGEEFTKQCIEVLDNYKGASGRKYKDDYRAILSWVVKRVQQDNKTVVKSTVTSNPFADLLIEEETNDKGEYGGTIDDVAFSIS